MICASRAQGSFAAAQATVMRTHPQDSAQEKTIAPALETRARYLEVETLIIGDRYSFIRDSYMQYQAFESSNGEDQQDDFVDDMDDFLLD